MPAWFCAESVVLAGVAVEEKVFRGRQPAEPRPPTYTVAPDVHDDIMDAIEAAEQEEEMVVEKGGEAIEGEEAWD